MKIDPIQFERIAATALGAREQGFRDGPAALTGAQAEAILAIAELAISADDREDADEAEVIELLAREVRALAGGAGEPIAASDDGDELADLTTDLSGPSAELAYAVAYVVTIADLAIAPAEEGFLEDLRAELAIDPDRADELIAAINAALTPA